MLPKALLVFLVVYFLSDFSHGQRNETSFRKDYSYIEVGNSYYKFHAAPKNWRDAKQVCAQEGARLFYPESGDETNAVLSFWKQYEVSNYTWVYVGISDLTTEGVFETIDGKPVSEVYNTWKPNNPDNYEDKEDCVHLHQSGILNDINCEEQYKFICKRSLPPKERNYSSNNQDSILDGQRNETSFRKDYSYIEVGNSYYKFHAAPKNWRDAKEVCAQEGARLFYPESGDETNAVLSFWKQYEVSNYTWVYVGISDLTTEGVFETIDGKPVSEVYNTWKPNNPDNYEDKEDCVHLHQSGILNDINCEEQYKFICKRSLPPKERNYSSNNQDSSLDEQRNETSFRKDYSYIEVGDSYYKFHAESKNWRDAKQVCAQEGARLFYPESGDETNAVLSFWKQYEVSNYTWVYVGISDLTTEGVFETIDGKPVSEVYNTWKPNNPDNYEDKEDCVHLHQSGILNDINCEEQYKFICKRSLPPKERNYSSNNQDSILDGQSNETYLRKEYSYIEAGNSYYKFHAESKNWRDAKEVCAQEGARLFYPESGDETNAVLSFWKQYEVSNYTWVYVGISDLTTEGVFETIDGKPVSEVYNTWKPNNPDNYEDKEDCVHLHQSGILNDINCEEQYKFICKRSLPPKERNYSSNNQDSNLDNKQRDKQFFRKDYDYIEAVESFYKIHTTPQTWDEAKRVCALEGATFWHPDNDNEAHAVISFWNTTQPHIGKVYVGMSDKMLKGLFETIDGKLVSEVYNNWQPRQPDLSGGTHCCVYMNKDGHLDDYGCHHKYSFVCKKSLQSLKWNSRCNMPNLDYTFNEDTSKCYKFHTTPMSWIDAYAVCRLEQSNLAVISSRQEADYLVNLTESTPKPRVKENYQRGIYHVGFHNRFNEGWQTVKGTPMDVDTDIWWDNYKPAEDRDQCGSMFFTGRLINTDCDMKSFFICEHEKFMFTNEDLPISSQKLQNGEKNKNK